MAASRQLRTARETGQRLLLLASVCAVAGDRSLRTSIRSWLTDEGLWTSASPAERHFLEASRSTAKREIEFSWKAEGVYVLGWALRLSPKLLPPTAPASTGSILDRIPAPGESVASFLTRARLRPAPEIRTAATHLLDAHWSCRNAALHSRPEPHGSDIEVVQERHRTANWLICHEEADWDLVATDT
jgi:Domain of unknown function (DUF4272)